MQWQKIAFSSSSPFILFFLLSLSLPHTFLCVSSSPLYSHLSSSLFHLLPLIFCFPPIVPLSHFLFLLSFLEIHPLFFTFSFASNVIFSSPPLSLFSFLFYFSFLNSLSLLFPPFQFIHFLHQLHLILFFLFILLLVLFFIHFFYLLPPFSPSAFLHFPPYSSYTFLFHIFVSLLVSSIILLSFFSYLLHILMFLLLFTSSSLPFLLSWPAQLCIQGLKGINRRCLSHC